MTRLSVLCVRMSWPMAATQHLVPSSWNPFSQSASRSPVILRKRLAGWETSTYMSPHAGMQEHRSVMGFGPCWESRSRKGTSGFNARQSSDETESLVRKLADLRKGRKRYTLILCSIPNADFCQVLRTGHILSTSSKHFSDMLACHTPVLMASIQVRRGTKP